MKSHHYYRVFRNHIYNQFRVNWLWFFCAFPSSTNFLSFLSFFTILRFIINFLNFLNNFFFIKYSLFDCLLLLRWRILNDLFSHYLFIRNPLFRFCIISRQYNIVLNVGFYFNSNCLIECWLYWCGCWLDLWFVIFFLVDVG